MGSKIDELDLRDVVAKRAPSQEIGSTGIDYADAMTVTEDRLPSLAGVNRYRVYEDMIRDVSIIAAGVRLFLNLISKATWQVDPAEDENGNISPKAQEIADLVADMMHDHKTNWHRIVRRVAMYKFTGFSIHEWYVKRRPDGAIGMADVSHRPPKTIIKWDLERGQVKGVWQRTTVTGEQYLPRDRLVYAVDDALTDHPQGMGLMRHLVKAATRLQGLEDLEQVAYENDLRGLPIAYGPWQAIRDKFKGTADAAAQVLKAKQPFLDFVRGSLRGKKTGILVDSDTYRTEDERRAPSNVRKWEVSLLRGDADGAKEIGEAITRVAQEIARVLGVEHLLLGADGSGSLALARSKVGTFYLTVISTQYELVEIMEADWLGPLAILNGWPEELVPSLAVEEVRDENIEEITTALGNLARAGVMLTPNDPAVAEVFQMIGLTPPLAEVDPEESLLEAPEDEPSEIDIEDADADLEKLRKARRWVRSRNRKQRRV
jgi:hypothetical protein